MEGGSQYEQPHDGRGGQPPEKDHEAPGEHPDDGAVDPGEAEPRVTPRIYVASLNDYNAGRLHGVWLEADQDIEELQAQISGMLAGSPEPLAEEWAIHDFEGFGAVRLGEWEDLERVSRIARGIREHGLAFAHWVNLAGEDDDLDRFQDAYLGHWDSVTAYAESMLEDLGLDWELDRGVPENLRPYVTLDAEGFGRDLEMGGDISTVEGEGGVYVFWNR